MNFHSSPTLVEETINFSHFGTLAIKGAVTKPAAPSFLDLMGTEMVDFYVGPRQRLFRVHKKILCDKVEYFNKMFGSNFTEAHEGIAYFPEDTPASFDALLRWIYDGTLQTNYNLFDLYGLGEKLLMTELQDRVMDKIIEQNRANRSLPSRWSIRKAYIYTTEGSPIRKYASQALRRWMTLKEETWPVAYTQQLMKEIDDLSSDILILLREDPVGRNPKEAPNCEFHHHGKDKACSYNA